ncbi:MAG: ABC transporter substrate-binding protein, partial [Mesorhizobium sp.]
VKAEDVCTNDLIPAANDFDKAKVKADAEGVKLSEGFAALDVDKIKAHLFDSAVK